MGIRSFLGLSETPQRSTSSETETIRNVVEALDHLPEDHARFIAGFGYVLGRVAHADLKISAEETAAMERLVMQHGGLPQDQAIIVVQMAKTQAQLFGATEDFLVTREFQSFATREQKLALVDCAFAVAAAEGHISVTEDNAIRQIVSELRLDHPDFIAVRSRWKDQLLVLQGLPSAPQ